MSFYDIFIRGRPYLDPNDFVPDGYGIVTALSLLYPRPAFFQPYPEGFLRARVSADPTLRPVTFDWPAFQGLVLRRRILVLGFPSYVRKMEEMAAQSRRVEEHLRVSPAYVKAITPVAEVREKHAGEVADDLKHWNLNSPQVAAAADLIRMGRRLPKNLLKRHLRVLEDHVAFVPPRERDGSADVTYLPPEWQNIWRGLGREVRFAAVLEYDRRNDVSAIRAADANRWYLGYQQFLSVVALAAEPHSRTRSENTVEFLLRRKHMVGRTLDRLIEKAGQDDVGSMVHHVGGVRRLLLHRLLDNVERNLNRKGLEYSDNVIDRCIAEYGAALRLPRSTAVILMPILVTPWPWAVRMTIALGQLVSASEELERALRFFRGYDGRVLGDKAATWARLMRRVDRLRKR